MSLPVKTAGIILAAGQSRRMGDLNKMTMLVDEKPMVRHVVDAALGSRLDTVMVVTGHEKRAVEGVLAGTALQFVHNPNFEKGLSTSLTAGVASLKADIDVCLILLGDMPFIRADMINAMLELQQANSGSIITATHEGKRGNPVLWPRAYFDELRTVSGDKGAREILQRNQSNIIEVEIGEAASIDLDTTEAIDTFTSKA